MHESAKYFLSPGLDNLCGYLKSGEEPELSQRSFIEGSLIELCSNFYDANPMVGLRVK
jgi:hypothetical protein